jgi:ketosteroid isomerase-like protein
VLGSLALAAVLGLLLYAWRDPAGDEAANANVNDTPAPVSTPTVQAESTPATQAVTPSPLPQPSVAQPATAPTEKERGALLTTVDSWVAAHNARNLTQVTNFYMPNVSTFYLAQNTTRAAVRAEKARLFQTSTMTIRRTSEPQITFGQDGNTATTVFRKSYSRGDAAQSQGEVLQEIIWQKTNRGWKVVSERDLRVLR